MRQKALVRAAAVIAAAFLILLALSAALAPVEAENTAAEREAIFQTLLPGGGPYVEEPYSGEDTNISAVYRGSTGYIVETVTAGYAGDITMLMAVDFQGTVVGAVVRDMEETFGLGRGVLTDIPFLAQFIGTTGEAEIGDGVDAITGATVTSRAIARGVSSACGYVTGADVTTSASEWGG